MNQIALHQPLISAQRVPADAAFLHAGGIRTAPTDAHLWQALGNCALKLSTKEYALTRALQLDPKLVPAWCALARLYIDRGETTLAGRCLVNARSHEPTAGAIWEGMGALAACSPTGLLCLAMMPSSRMHSHLHQPFVRSPIPCYLVLDHQSRLPRRCVAYDGGKRIICAAV